MTSRSFLAMTLAAGACAEESSLQGSMNPIRKVVTLLQSMQAKVTEEGEREKELYDKYMCWCKTGTGGLSADIDANEAKVPQVSSDIKTGEEQMEQAKADLKAAQTDRSAAKQTIQEAIALRQKEAAAFATTKSEADTNIAAIQKAIAALEKGQAGSFLQTNTAQVLRQLLSNSDIEMVDADRQDLLAFLENKSDYAPVSGEIIGMLKQCLETMSRDLADATATEQAATKAFAGLLASKKKEIAALSATIEAKTARIGELGVSIVQMKDDLSDSEAALLEDQQFLAQMETGCKTKTAEWEERSKLRAEELVALADTIKVLNDDDALDLFKKTLSSPGASLVQMSNSLSSTRTRALHLIRSIRSSDRRPALDLMVLTLVGKKGGSAGGFDQVIKMIDDLVALLKQEQLDDEHKREYCLSQLAQAEEKKKDLEVQIETGTINHDDAQVSLDQLNKDIEDLKKAIKDLDNKVAEATEQRKREHAEYKDLIASDTAAKEVLLFAKNRLNKFYNKALYKEAPKQELSREDRIFVNNGGTPPPTAAPGGIAGTGVTAFVQVSAHSRRDVEAPAPPPATWDSYAKKSGQSNGVIAMIDLLIKDLVTEMREAEAEEKAAQKEYEEMMKDAAARRAQYLKSLAEKEAAKAETEAKITEVIKPESKSDTKELMAVDKYIAALHAECSWLLEHFDTRKAARADEIDSLGRAKAVLSGADYSLVQVRTHGNLRKPIA